MGLFFDALKMAGAKNMHSSSGCAITNKILPLGKHETLLRTRANTSDNNTKASNAIITTKSILRLYLSDKRMAIAH